MSSESDEWETPDDLFYYLNQQHFFTIDVCATPQNAKLGKYFTQTEDGLKQPWDGAIWCNPPYTNHQAIDWINKGLHELAKNPLCVKCVFLIPVRTDTKLWHHTIMKHANTVIFLEGRLSFKQPTRDHLNPAPFPSCVVIFTQSRKITRYQSLSKKGYQHAKEAKLF